MSRYKTVWQQLAAISLATLVSGCVYPGVQQQFPNCPPQQGPGTPIESFPPTLDDSLTREFSDMKARVQELAMQLSDARADRDRLQDQVSRMQRERSSTANSVSTASHEIAITRNELDRAAEEIRFIRLQLQQVIDEVSNRDAVHASQMGQFLRRLDGLAHEYGVDSGLGSYPLVPLTPQKP